MSLAPGFLTAARFAELAGGRVVSGDPSHVLSRFSINTRTLRAGDVFVALQGPRFDGHDFVARAFAAGASGVVVSNPSALQGIETGDAPVVAVADTERALQDVARGVRLASGATVVAITGSAGKTTTKEATATLLASTFRTMRNLGNFNNHFGLPVSLLDLQHGAEVAVVELGMSGFGEIRTLVGIAAPDVRVWTNVGTAHIEFFGTQDAIAEAKAEVLEGATSRSVFVANADDPRVAARIPGFPGRVVTFGVGADADVRAERVQSRGLDGTLASVRTPAGTVDIEIALAGNANLANVLAAIAVATTLGVPLPAIAAAARTIAPAKHRGEVLRLGRDVVVYDDCYNASPSALEKTLELVRAEPSVRRRVAFLGEMRELGDASLDLHRRSGQHVADSGIAQLVAVGGTSAQALAEGASAANRAIEVALVATSGEAADLVPAVVQTGDLVLVKGSRGVEMERVVERLQVEFA